MECNDVFPGKRFGDDGAHFRLCVVDRGVLSARRFEQLLVHYPYVHVGGLLDVADHVGKVGFQVFLTCGKVDFYASRKCLFVLPREFVICDECSPFYGFVVVLRSQ